MLKKATQQEKGQRGAIIVEATLALPVFMFAIYTLLSVVQIAYTQARVNVALDTATKQMAEYMNVYYATGMGETFSGTGGKSSEIADEVGEFLQDLGGELGSFNEGAGQYVNDAGQAVSGDSITDILKNLIGTHVVEQMLYNNLRDNTGDTYKAFMKRNRIENMDMDGSKVLEVGSHDLFMRVNYDVRVVRLLNLDYSFHFSHCAYAQAWAGEK